MAITSRHCANASAEYRPSVTCAVTSASSSSVSKGGTGKGYPNRYSGFPAGAGPSAMAAVMGGGIAIAAGARVYTRPLVTSSITGRGEPTAAVEFCPINDFIRLNSAPDPVLAVSRVTTLVVSRTDVTRRRSMYPRMPSSSISFWE